MNTKNKIAIIGTVGLPANYGGFETLAEHLVENLNQEYDFTVYCSGKKYSKPDRKKSYKNAKLVYIPLEANGIQSILYDTISILHALFYADVLLVLGVAGAWILPLVKLFTNKKIIISIDGIEWKRDKWSKMAKWYLFWAESIAVKYSHIDISDNESIQDYTAMRYGSLSRIIEYGADHTLQVKPSAKDRQEFHFLNKTYAFKVCRIEPENNVHEVLEAFAKLPKHHLVMVGNWKNSEYGVQTRAKYEAFANISLLDPIYDQHKLDVLRGNAFLYIHGHSAGGTNPSLVEAMYLGLPIIAYGVSYNRTTTENKALYFKDHEDLIATIKKTSVVELKNLGNTMQKIAQRRYTWGFIADKYKNLIVEALAIKSKVSIIPKSNAIDNSTLLDLNLAHLKYQQMFFQKR
jgi:glycosyltransferase involved in cell wall biosynthesis